ncbi:MAG: tRNA (N(6)-L-threonylcarbamoyladenosine(37)-C(2))-methylthiotransferase MtaB [Lachnospirales bacterium]
MRVALYTLGCKVNSYETDRIRETFQSEGAAIVPFTEPADVYVVNTCTVTQMAAKKSRQILHRARRLNPEALIVATGCFVQTGRDGMPAGAVDLYVSNADKSQLVQRVNDAMRDRKLLNDSIQAPEEEMKHTRAFLKIQDGCRQYCSYCIIPYVRGPLQSRDPEDILAEVRHLVSQGYKELVLTGIHLSSYGRQGTFADPNARLTLGRLIQRLNEVEGLERIRLGSLEPGLITDSYLEEIAQTDKLCPHYHLSLQSGCAKTLRAMNRRYTPDEYVQAVERLRRFRPETAITTDLIVGFPGETEEDFEESLAFLRQIGFSQVHVFKYSMREGTAAARRTDQVPEEVKHARSERTIQVAEELSWEFASRFIGSVREVLLEKAWEHGWEGYTDHYIRTLVEGEKTLGQRVLSDNQIVPVRFQSCVRQNGEIYLKGVIT